MGWKQGGNRTAGIPSHLIPAPEELIPQPGAAGAGTAQAGAWRGGDGGVGIEEMRFGEVGMEGWGLEKLGSQVQGWRTGIWGGWRIEEMGIVGRGFGGMGMEG